MKIKSEKRNQIPRFENSSLPKKINSIPIHRHAFKGKYLQKHASLLKNSQNVNGILISCTSKSETRAIGQSRSFLQSMMDTLFPDSNPVWPERNGENNTPSLPKNDETDPISVKDEIVPNDNLLEITKDRKFQYVDTGCSGLIFVRFRNDIKPTDFMHALLPHIQKNPNCALLQSISFCTVIIYTYHILFQEIHSYRPSVYFKYKRYSNSC